MTLSQGVAVCHSAGVERSPCTRLPPAAACQGEGGFEPRSPLRLRQRPGLARGRPHHETRWGGGVVTVQDGGGEGWGGVKEGG